MRRILAGLFAALFLGALALESFHHHDSFSAPQSSCIVCAAATQARQAPATAPVAAQSAAFVVLAPQAVPCVVSPVVLASSARAPPSAA